MLLAVLLTGLICTLTWNNVLLQASAAEPGYLDFDNLPETNFSCESKVIGGYYADVETGCQMFHVCTIGQKGEVADIKFLCLNGTVFDQETRVCERLDEVDCSKSESYYDLNLELYGNSGATYGIQPENEEEPPASNDNDDDKCEEEEDCKTEPLPNNKPGDLEEEYEEIEDPTTSSTSTTTTPRPSTSPRPAQIPYPTSSPETIAALLALHNAFQESLKEHERPGLPRVPGSFPSPVPVPVKLPPLPPPRFSSPVSFSTSPRPLSFALNTQQNYVGRNQQPALPQQSQVSNHHFPSPQTNKQQPPPPPPQPQSFAFNVSPKPKPLPGFTSTIRTSQAFGNSNFQQSFREEQQQQQQKQQQQQQQYQCSSNTSAATAAGC
uniref:Chitin-binding type-2 domain-containing protein n=2 Tax=Cacopsylla melanoneura TaxID=428564 RepID=A0A8D8S1K9_9HEMI